MLVKTAPLFLCRNPWGKNGPTTHLREACEVATLCGQDGRNLDRILQLDPITERRPDCLPSCKNCQRALGKRHADEDNRTAALTPDNGVCPDCDEYFGKCEACKVQQSPSLATAGEVFKVWIHVEGPDGEDCAEPDEAGEFATEDAANEHAANLTDYDQTEVEAMRTLVGMLARMDTEAEMIKAEGIDPDSHRADEVRADFRSDASDTLDGLVLDARGIVDGNDGRA